MRDQRDSVHDSMHEVRGGDESGGLTAVESTLILSILAIVTILGGTILQVTPSDLVDGLASIF